MEEPLITTQAAPSYGTNPAGTLQQAPQRNMHKPVSIAVLWILSAVTCIFVFFVLFLYSMTITPDSWFQKRQLIVQKLTFSDYVVIENQPLNQQFVVKQARLRKPGFLVLMYADDFNTPSDIIIGASRYLPQGIYSNESIEVHPEDFNRSAAKPVEVGTRMVAVIIYDDGNHEFEGIEQFAKDIHGNPILAHMTVL